jgi:uncharacterized RDD family membrane protein YckC
MDFRTVAPGGHVAAPFGARLLALAIDAAILVAAVALIVHGANLVFGPVTGTLFYMFWRDVAVTAVERVDLGRELDAGLDGAAIERTYARESRRYEDGSLRVFSVMTSINTAPDGAVARHRHETLVARNLQSLIRLRLTEALVFLLPFFYFAWLEGGRWQASLGKMALGLRVTDPDGARIGFGRSAFRQLMKTVEIGSTGLGYVLAAMTGRGQALHDILARTHVVRAAPLRPLAAIA